MGKLNLRIYCISLLIILSSILVACNGNETSKKEETPVEASKENDDKQTTDVQSEKQSNKQIEDESANTDVTEDTDSSTNMPNDTAGILKKSAEAMGEINGMVITGNIQSTTDMMGTTDNETSQITGAISYNPSSEHLQIHTVSDLDGESNMEIYLTKEAMYMSDPDDGGWLSVSIQQAGAFGDISAMITENQMNALAKQHKYFELTEDKDNFILHFTGSGEEFKNVVYGSMKDFMDEKGYKNFLNMFTDISGSYEFVIAKDTYYIVSLKMDLDFTMDLGVGEIHTIEQSQYEYSEFNEVEPVSVPKEITEKATSILDFAPNTGN